MTLQIIIQTIDDTDFDGNSISFKDVRTFLDGVDTNVGSSYPAATSDNDIKTEIKSKLTSLGYTWDNEI
jgi:hypothetical protein